MWSRDVNMEGETTEAGTEDHSEGEAIAFKQKKGKFSRRTQEEIALGFVVHLSQLFYWVFVHVYDATIIKGLSVEERNQVISNYEQTFGRWKYLTYINLVKEICVIPAVIMVCFVGSGYV